MKPVGRFARNTEQSCSPVFFRIGNLIMFIIAFRAGYPGAQWWFVAAYAADEAKLAQDAANNVKDNFGQNCKVICFEWEWK